MTMLAEKNETKALTLADYEARIYLYKEQIGTGYIGIGRTLIEAKEAGVVPHGEWEAWVERTAGLSARNAQRCMQAAREIRDGSAMARLEMSKALMLLGSGLDEDRREAIAEKAAEEGATVKALREEIEQTKKDLEVAGRVAANMTAKATKAAMEAHDAQEFAEGFRKALAEERQHSEELRGQLGNAKEYLQKEKEKAAREAAEDAENKLAKAYEGRLAELQDELDAAEKREARRAAELESLKAEKQSAAMDAARGLTVSGLDPLDLAAAVRAFIGAAGVIPQMGTTIRDMKPEDVDILRQHVEAVADWVAGARKALSWAVQADGYVM